MLRRASTLAIVASFVPLSAGAQTGQPAGPRGGPPPGPTGGPPPGYYTESAPPPGQPPPGAYEPPPPGYYGPAPVWEPPPPPKPKHRAPKTAFWAGARVGYFVPFGNLWQRYTPQGYEAVKWSDYASSGPML